MRSEEWEVRNEDWGEEWGVRWCEEWGVRWEVGSGGVRSGDQVWRVTQGDRVAWLWWGVRWGVRWGEVRWGDLRTLVIKAIGSLPWKWVVYLIQWVVYLIQWVVDARLNLFRHMSQCIYAKYTLSLIKSVYIISNHFVISNQSLSSVNLCTSFSQLHL